MINTLKYMHVFASMHLMHNHPRAAGKARDAPIRKCDTKKNGVRFMMIIFAFRSKLLNI